MKRVKWVITLLGMICLTGCFEIEEDINISQNGSGRLTVNTDMSQMLDIMQTYMGKEEMDKQFPQIPIDTTIHMKDLVDTARNISPEKKALLREGYMRMQLNASQKLFKSDLHFPFSSMANLQKLYTVMSDGSLGTTSLLKGLAGPKTSPSQGDTAMPDINQFNAIYDFESKDGLLSRKLNAQRWKALQDSPQFGQMKEAAGLGFEVPYSITIHTPRPVKKVDNQLARLSDDKMVVTMRYNLTEVFTSPEKFEYTIVY